MRAKEGWAGLRMAVKLLQGGWSVRGRGGGAGRQGGVRLTVGGGGLSMGGVARQGQARAGHRWTRKDGARISKEKEKGIVGKNRARSIKEGKGKGREERSGVG
ncbi:hypothetical protein Pcinc_024096 [Petrolisthes cinctipes]|uniref:Uncharacterized protein n=1 Tax=Petrolisthes cinctipes TaxID=88211 RepID=A0AAE1FCS2_PETCI|nr:hypothetical protein Pcinc_024096 [Petrolisthes cinctipes]